MAPIRSRRYRCCPTTDSVAVRRNPGTLPSRVADNFYWLGRYLERGEALLGAIRLMLGNSIDVDGGAALSGGTVGRLVGPDRRRWWRSAPADRCGAPISARSPDRDGGHRLAFGRDDQPPRPPASVTASRDRLSADMVRLLDAPFPRAGRACSTAPVRSSAATPRILGLSAEHMVRTASWRFHDLGRRIERAMAIARVVRAVRHGGRVGRRPVDAARPGRQPDQLSSALSDRHRRGCRWSIWSRSTPATRARSPSRSARIGEHLAALPVLGDDGMAEDQQALATALIARVATANAQTLDRRAARRCRTATGHAVGRDRAPLFPAGRRAAARGRADAGMS